MSATRAIVRILASFPDRWPIPLPASAVIVTALTLAINSWVAYDQTRDFFKDNQLFKVKGKLCKEDSFDYVVVGAGTAGMIVATRLANSSDQPTILLLEAGGEPSLLNDIPSMDFFLLNQPANTFVYNTTPLEYACQNCDDKVSRKWQIRLQGSV